MIWGEFWVDGTLDPLPLFVQHLNETPVISLLSEDPLENMNKRRRKKEKKHGAWKEGGKQKSEKRICRHCGGKY